MEGITILNTRAAAIAALILAAVLLSTAGVAFQLLSINNGLAISGYRSFFAAISYIVFFRAFPKMENTRWFKTAIIAYACATSFFVVSNTLTTAVNAVVLMYTSPIFACIFLVFIFKKPVPRYDIIAVALILFGICVFFVDSLTLQGSASMVYGNMFAIAAGAGFGMLAIVMGRTNTPRNAITFGNGLNVLIALPFMFMNPIGSLTDLAILVYLGVIQVGLSYLLYAFASSKVSPLELILIPAMEPILNPVWVFLFDRQFPSMLSVVGGVIIIGTIIIWSLYKQKFSDSKM